MANGVIYIGKHFGECCPLPFNQLPPGTTPFIAPYWIDSDPSVKGNVSYEVHGTNSPLLQRVSDYISVSQNLSFSGTWMMVAYWWDLPELFLDETVSTEYVVVTCLIQSTYQVNVYLVHLFYWEKKVVMFVPKSCCHVWIGTIAA